MVQPSRKPDYGQERARTDAGLTGDKIAALDPAAAPVNTDAETAGTPTSAPARGQEQVTREATSKAGMAPFAATRQRSARAWRRGAGPDGRARLIRRPGRDVLLTAGSLAVLIAAGLIAGFISVAAL